MRRFFVLYTVVGVFVAIAATSAFSQDASVSESAKAPAQAAPAAPAAAPAAPQVKDIAIYGEVQAVNAVANTLSVQYYDYDSDSEKTAEVTVTADTKLENARAVSDVKKGDWVDVTYVLSDGKNMAKTVSVEKEEPAVEPAGGMAGSAGSTATDTSPDE